MSTKTSLTKQNKIHSIRSIEKKNSTVKIREAAKNLYSYKQGPNEKKIINKRYIYFVMCSIPFQKEITSAKDIICFMSPLIELFEEK